MLKEQLIHWVLEQFVAMGGIMAAFLRQERELMESCIAYLFYNLDLLGGLSHNREHVTAFGRTY